ncbi:MAG: hypothetical protein NDI61_00185 [Bdellovibrionaceae bacterium]|nr:hypothetical protein [Pseudobdellovibrionaceae bacterium]
MDALLVRLNQIFSSLVGSRLTYVPLAQIDVETWGADELAAIAGRASGAPPYLTDQQGRSIGFPVRDPQNALAGLAIVSEWRLADSRRVFDLADFAAALIERRLSGTNDQGEVLRRTEEHLQMQTMPKNVIPLRRNRLPQSEHLWPVPPPPKINAPSLMIQVKPGFPVQQFASEVHSRTERWAFVAWTDLPHDSLDSRETWKQLGAITLFIEDLTQLSLERQAQLAAFVRSLPSEETPLILAAIHEDPDVLEERGDLDAGLRAALTYARMPWNPQDNDSLTIRKSMRLLIDGRAPEQETRFVPFHKSLIDDDQPTMH